MAYAPLGLWLLKLNGSRRVRVLDLRAGHMGGSKARPVDSAQPDRRHCVFPPRQGTAGSVADHRRVGGGCELATRRERSSIVRKKLEYQRRRFWPSGAAPNRGARRSHPRGELRSKMSTDEPGRFRPRPSCGSVSSTRPVRRWRSKCEVITMHDRRPCLHCLGS